MLQAKYKAQSSSLAQRMQAVANSTVGVQRRGTADALDAFPRVGAGHKQYPQRELSREIFVVRGCVRWTVPATVQAYLGRGMRANPSKCWCNCLGILFLRVFCLLY